MAHRRIKVSGIAAVVLSTFAVVVLSSASKGFARTRVSIKDKHWQLNGYLTYPATDAEGLLMNVRMVNADWRPLGDSNPCYRRERAVS